MLLRCTAKVLALLRVRELTAAEPGGDDWYANLLWLDGRKCLLLVHAGTMFPVFAADVRAADLRPLGSWVCETIERELEAEALPADVLGALDPDVQVAKTASRSVLGVMHDMALHAEYAVGDAGRLLRLDVPELNHSLRRGLHQRGGTYVTALELVAERIVQRRRPLDSTNDR